MTKIDWSGLGMKGVVPVEFEQLGELEELCLLEKECVFEVPSGLQGLRERVGLGPVLGGRPE